MGKIRRKIIFCPGCWYRKVNKKWEKSNKKFFSELADKLGKWETDLIICPKCKSIKK